MTRRQPRAWHSFQSSSTPSHESSGTNPDGLSGPDRSRRTITAAGKTFEYHRLKRAAFTGYQPTKVGGETVLIATPEKALVDYLYYVDLKKKTLNERLTLRLAWSRVRSYARLFERPSLTRLIQQLA